MNRRSLAKGMATFSLALSAIFADQSPTVAAERAIATVTIAGVHYILPRHSHFNDTERVELKASNPLCHVYQYYYMTIINRELFINGLLAYKARPGDRVVVSYVAGGEYWRAVRVNGRPTVRPPEKRLDNVSCSSIDNGDAKRVIRRAPPQ